MAIALLLCGLLAQTAAQAPRPSPTAQYPNVYRAAVEDMASWVTPSLGGAPTVIEVDPRVLTSGSRLPVAGADLHAAPAIAGVGAPGRIVVVTQARAEECAGMGARTCRKDGVWVGVVLESPVITGETATVKVFVRVSRAPTEAEKARLQQSGRSQATIARFSEEAGSATLFQLSLISKNGMWSVASRRIIGQS